jgi:hypothetical protein
MQHALQDPADWFCIFLKYPKQIKIKGQKTEMKKD